MSKLNEYSKLVSKLIIDGPKQELDQTENTQPAIFLASYSIFKALEKETSFKVNNAKFFAGHSLGEYSALCCAQSITFEQTINLLKYKEGNFYSPHIDAFHTVNRQLSFIFCLNNNYDGGELFFFHPVTKKPYSQAHLNVGDLIMFPSNFLYPHQVSPITKGTRYSVVAWYS